MYAAADEACSAMYFNLLRHGGERAAEKLENGILGAEMGLDISFLPAKCKRTRISAEEWEKAKQTPLKAAALEGRPPLVWDEVTLEEHNKLRGTRQQINEIETPYTYFDTPNQRAGTIGKYGVRQQLIVLAVIELVCRAGLLIEDDAKTPGGSSLFDRVDVKIDVLQNKLAELQQLQEQGEALVQHPAQAFSKSELFAEQKDAFYLNEGTIAKEKHSKLAADPVEDDPKLRAQLNMARTRARGGAQT